MYQARDIVGDEPVLIVLGDMIFENGYESFLEAHAELGRPDASIGVKPVEEPSHYGVVETEGDHILGLVEKPDVPPSDLAISGVYVIEDTPTLFGALGNLVENDIRGAGDEYQLTDGRQLMIDEGSTMKFFEVEDWYDCGRP
ncbi:sugar phosphate nucleotidyltransferase, partial [Halorubrum sp. Atlit-26R]|uniref:sugar phosphate nucleotidyltransferase n=1 Tax=Halorubrum sp. Atlit-26R TaxID=2282128 RepID=UPI00210077C0